MSNEHVTLQIGFITRALCMKWFPLSCERIFKGMRHNIVWLHGSLPSYIITTIHNDNGPLIASRINCFHSPIMLRFYVELRHGSRTIEHYPATKVLIRCEIIPRGNYRMQNQDAFYHFTLTRARTSLCGCEMIILRVFCNFLNCIIASLALS